MSQLVTFAGNNINEAPGVDIYNHDFNALPKREIKINKIARQDRSIITSSEYSSKEIPVYAEVCNGSRADTEVALTYLKSLIQGQNQILSVPQGSDTVSYTATLNEFDIKWDGTTALVTMVFLASDPVGEVATLSTVFSSTFTQSSILIPGVVGGSFTIEPTINVVISSLTGGTGASVSIRNAATQQGITITQDFTAGDTLIIDSKNQITTLNGLEIDFEGRYPIFFPGTQTLEYSDTFTTRSVTLTAQAKFRVV